MQRKPTTPEVKVHVDYVEDEQHIEVPDGFECPITTDLMEDPVMAADGHSYERAAISQWLAGGRRISPLTGAKLSHTLLTPNHALKKAIHYFLKQRPGLVAIKQEMRAAQSLEQQMQDLALAIQLREQDLAAQAAKNPAAKMAAAMDENEEKGERKEVAPKPAASVPGNVPGAPIAAQGMIDIAKQKHHPRAEVASALVKVNETETSLEQLRKENAANKIKRFYLRHAKHSSHGGLKAWMKASRLYDRQASTSHQLETVIEKQKNLAKQFELDSKQQEQADAKALADMKAEQSAKVTQAMAAGAWDTLGALGKEASEAQQRLTEKQTQAKQARSAAYQKAQQQCEAEQKELKQKLQQVHAAKADKARGVLQRTKPIAVITETLDANEKIRALFLKEQTTNAAVLHKQIDPSFFKPAPVPTPNPPEIKLDPAQITQVLKHVAWGEQDEAEVHLKKEPYLALIHGEVTDCAGRTFKKITAFQYAVWALDWHMWEMMLRQFKDEHYALVAQQYQELDEKGTEHGKQFSLDPLINALQTFSDKFAGWTDAQRKEHWYKVVGGEQAKLPMHVVNEYCRPDRTFEMKGNMFLEPTLPRGKGREKEWWHYDGKKDSDGSWKYTVGGKGGDWAWCRGADGYHTNIYYSILQFCVPIYISGDDLLREWTTRQIIDRDALLALGQTRNQQKDKLSTYTKEKTAAARLNKKS
jgi:hypothetical protein